MTETLEKIRNTFSARREQAAGDYAELVSAVASGGQFDADKAAKILDQVDKTPQDLADAVAALTERRRLRAIVDAEGPAKKRIADIDAALEKIESKRQAFDQKCDNECWPLTGEREELQATITAAFAARRGLLETCTDESIRSRGNEIGKQVAAISAAISRLRDDRERFGQLATDAHRVATATMESDGRRIEGNEHADAYRTTCQDIDARLAALEAERAKLLAEQEELNARRLNP